MHEPTADFYEELLIRHLIDNQLADVSADQQWLRLNDKGYQEIGKMIYNGDKGLCCAGFHPRNREEALVHPALAALLTQLKHSSFGVKSRFTQDEKVLIDIYQRRNYLQITPDGYYRVTDLGLKFLKQSR